MNETRAQIIAGGASARSPRVEFDESYGKYGLTATPEPHTLSLNTEH